MIYLDANIFLHANFDTGDLGRSACALFKKITDGLQACTCALTVDEVLWAMKRQKLTDDPFSVIEEMYAIPHLQIVDVPARAPLDALRWMRRYDLRPRDAIHVAVMRINGVRSIVTTDGDFERVKEVTAIPLPGER